uniref:Uncharacterized protein n=1 Tax=Utricularia reniformis TaxID=192314 RepID=A0A1Y0B1N4_9LAMI|nr:hypothetical protein AEK19_MT1061 [Utricularia reniformis]ART31283.1 hypothetical protein AEK19_MT1061 [Utricularia reniformis]
MKHPFMLKRRSSQPVYKEQPNSDRNSLSIWGGRRNRICRYCSSSFLFIRRSAYRSIPYSRSQLKNGSLPLASLSLSISQVSLV